MLFPDLKELIKLKSILYAAGSAQYRLQNRSHGEYTAILHGQGVEFETIRPYVVGDDVRYIDWRTTARTSRPQVKTFRAECDRNVFVVVDANAYMRFGTQGTFKSIQAAKAAAIMAWKSLQQQDRVGGLVFGDIAHGMQYFKPSKADTATVKLLRVLCEQQTDVHPQISIVDALQHLLQIITPQSVVVIVSDFSVMPVMQLQRALYSLRKKAKVVLMPIYDPSDVQIPDAGFLACTHIDQQIMVNTSSLQGRKLYHQQWLDYHASLNTLGKKLQIPIFWIETTLDPVKALWNS